MQGMVAKLQASASKQHENQINESDSDDELKPLEELGGIIVYDSQAKLIGSQKIEQYFNEVDLNTRAIDPYLLFPRSTVEDLSQLSGFNDPPQARDFHTQQERNLHRNIPKPFPQQRNYACLLYTSPSPRDKRQSRMPSSA